MPEQTTRGKLDANSPEQPSEMAVRDRLVHTILYHAGGFPEKAKKAADAILAEFQVWSFDQYESIINERFRSGRKRGRAEVIAQVEATINSPHSSEYTTAQFKDDLRFFLSTLKSKETRMRTTTSTDVTDDE